MGCIPSKAWLDSSHKYADLCRHTEDHGIKAQKISLDFHQMRSRVENIVRETAGGVEFLMKKNKITLLEGHASFKGPHTLEVVGQQTREVTGKHIVIATGAKPASLPNLTVDKDKIITSTEALYLKERPKSLAVIGGGAIGLEMASVFARLGTEVTVIEYADKLIATMDVDLSKALARVPHPGRGHHRPHKLCRHKGPCEPQGPCLCQGPGHPGQTPPGGRGVSVSCGRGTQALHGGPQPGGRGCGPRREGPSGHG